MNSARQRKRRKPTILVGMLFFLLSTLAGINRSYANDSGCEGSKLLASSDGISFCLNNTIFQNLTFKNVERSLSVLSLIKAAIDPDISVKKYDSKELILSVTSNPQACTAVQFGAATLWGESYNSLRSKSSCNSYFKETGRDSSCECATIQEIAKSKTKLEFDEFQINYAKRISAERQLNIADILAGTKLSIPSNLVPSFAKIETETARSAAPSHKEDADISANLTQKRIALVIGNAGYKVGRLTNPINDANDISAALRQSNFEVIELRDANLSEMRAAIREFGDKLLSSDVGLLYYSGHGLEIHGKNYLVPTNADIQRQDEVADQSIDMSLIIEKMNTAQQTGGFSKTNILIVDACRDNPFSRSFRTGSRGLASIDAPSGTIIAFSTSPGKVASDGDPKSRNSPYTRALLKSMTKPNLPIELMFKEVRKSVQDETGNTQTPWENTSLSGNFFFSPQQKQ